MVKQKEPAMTLTQATEDVFPTDLLERVVRRVAAERLAHPDDVDELIQETLTRVLEARDRLDPDVLRSYAAMTALNLIASERRQRKIERRWAPRVVEPEPVVDPEDLVARAEDRRALGAALRRLPLQDRRLLLEHEVEGRAVSSLARETSATSGAMAARLHRIRARLRVDYLFTSTHTSPPTNGCRAVLEAISARDIRRQQRLGAKDHLLACDSCAQMAPYLIEGRRPLPLLIPLLAAKKIAALVQAHPVASGTIAAAAGATAVAIAVSGAHHPGSRPLPVLSIAGQPGSAARLSHLQRYEGRTAIGRGIRVLSIPADEGFWAGKPGARVWVQIRVRGESPAHVKAGQRVRFEGTIVRNRPALIRRLGVERGQRRRLTEQGAHIAVPVENLSISQEDRGGKQER